MKLLVLGNGFDLDHKLPTSYKEFMNFCAYLVFGRGYLDENYEKLTDIQKKYVEKLEKKNNINERLLSLLQNNCLFQFFNLKFRTQREVLGENWIDLEREIKSVVDILNSFEDEYTQSKQNRYRANTEHRIHELIEELKITEIDSGRINETSLELIHKRLLKALNDFIKALEIYIVHFINETPVRGVSPDIIDFDATNIITFNYSNTYERVYGGAHWNEIVHHIHGSANANQRLESNVVLGVTTQHNQAENRYVEFEKYFQRITKKTGNDYTTWLESPVANNKAIEVAFFGHSLDATDSDIISDLICNKKTSIIVFYYDEKALQTIVANLIEIIGKQTLIEYVSGKKPKITFRKQRTHQHANTAGIEIERDVRKLYRLYSLKSSEIQKLLQKIDKRVKHQKTSYFFTQRKTIDLFEAIKFIGIEDYTVNEFFEICERLDIERTNTGELIKFDDDEWYGETSWGEPLHCHQDTAKLIDLINQSNTIRFHEMQAKEPYAEIIAMNDAQKIKEALLEVFEKEASETYWKNLSRLITLMIDDENLYEAVQLLAEEKHPVQIATKIQHFVLSYYEHYHNYQFSKQMAEENS